MAGKGFKLAQVCKAPEVVVVDYPSRGNGSYVSSVMAYGSKELYLDNSYSHPLKVAQQLPV